MPVLVVGTEISCGTVKTVEIFCPGTLGLIVSLTTLMFFEALISTLIYFLRRCNFRGHATIRREFLLENFLLRFQYRIFVFTMNFCRCFIIEECYIDLVCSF